MKKLIFRISVLLLVSVLIQCGKKDDASPKSSITLTVDGTSKTVVFTAAALVFENQNDHEGRTINITGTVNGNPLSIEVANWDFQNPPVNGIKIKTYSNIVANQAAAECLMLSDGVTELCDGAMVTYFSSSTTFYMTGLYDGADSGTLKVTACDPSKKTISGEFDMKASDGSGTNVALKGKFENVTYTIVK